MTQYREIYVGRDRSCDIKLSPDCRAASSMHAILYMDGQVLMYRDQSRNGTYINNVKVHQRAVPIKRGDYIMLAGLYPLSWNVIERFFPPRYNNYPDAYYSMVAQPQLPKEEERVPDLNKFNWGAFFLYPIWGFFNGCWWAFLVSIVCFWAGIFVSILFGVYGTRLAWENRNWESAEQFEETQRSWAQWGLIVFLIGIVMAVFIYIFFFGLILGLLSDIFS